MSLTPIADTLRQVDALRAAVTATGGAQARIAELERALADEKAKVAALTGAIESAFAATARPLAPVARTSAAATDDAPANSIIEEEEEISTTDPGFARSASDSDGDSDNERSEDIVRLKVRAARTDDAAVTWARLSCPACTRTFATKANLHSHLRVHAPRAPGLHACPECGKEFATRGYLKRHVAYGRHKAPAPALAPASTV